MNGIEVKLFKRVRISAPSRLHLGLVSMARDRFRNYGGIGFAIQAFDTTIEACLKSNSSSEVTDLRQDDRAFSKWKLEKIRRLLDRIAQSECLNALEVKVLDSPPQNSGFGSGTSLELACIESLFLCNGRAVAPKELVKFSTRGCTSGVGIKTYFQGGFVFDLGVPADGVFRPSSAAAADSQKSVLSKRWEFPNWEIVVFLPVGNLLTPSGAYEEDFFVRNSPIDESEVYHSAFLATFGVLPGVLSLDKISFAKAVAEMQSVGWKKLEWSQYGDKLFLLSDELKKIENSGFGMSSMGPAIFCLADPLGERFKCPTGFEMHRIFPNNTGRVVERC